MVKAEVSLGSPSLKKQTLKCPKCFSFFIINHRCKSCGFHLRRTWSTQDILNNDFYFFRDRYKQNMRPIYKRYRYFFFKRHPLYINYCSDLSRRFQSIIGYFLYEDDLPPSISPHLFFEFKDLVNEMNSLGILKDSLFRRLENLRPQTQKTLSNIIKQSKTEFVENKYPFFLAWKKYLFNSNFFVLALFFYGIVIVLSIKAFKVLYLNP